MDRPGFACYGSVCILAALVFIVFCPALLSAQSLKIDLGTMSEKLEIRYYIAEKGTLPFDYILLGGISLCPNFLRSDFDFRERIVEYDDETGLLYSYRVPKHRRFTRDATRRGAFYYYTPRNVEEPGIDIELATIDQRQTAIKERVRRTVWLEDVKYNLKLERGEGHRKGLLNIDIPIKLPKQIERIIGKGEATNLTVSGRENIKIGGESNWCANCPQTEGRPKQQKFPDLDMEQQLSVNLHGTIGEKINVAIDHSSMGGGLQSTNRVRINYTGFDDDIIKLIEMGDTDLILRGAQLISYSGSAKGLFGVKAQAQLGPLDLTIIASKEEGETATGTYTSSGTAASKTTISDFNYIKRQYFYLENPGWEFNNAEFYNTSFTIEDMRVFVTIRPDLQEEIDNDIRKYNIITYTDPNNNGLDDEIAAESDSARTARLRRFKEIKFENNDFDYIQEYGGSGGTKYVGIRLAQPLDENRALAVIYRAKKDLGDNEFAEFDVGSYSNPGEILYAELICPLEVEFTPQSDTWKMMMRNVYSLGGVRVDNIRSLDVRIENKDLRENRDIDPNYKEGYLRIFGLDRWDETGSPRVGGSDGRIDSDQGVVNPTLGYFMFPDPEPFSVSQEKINKEYFVLTIPEGFDDTYLDTVYTGAYKALVKRDTLYNTKNQTWKENTHKYDIVIEGGTGPRTFQLNAFDIIEGTEVVTVDGSKLARGVDYEIDYALGTVRLKGDAALLSPDARVNISYQHKPLIGGGKSALLGVGGELNLSRNLRLNGTFLYNSVGASRYNPRLGEEPAKTMAFDINGSFSFNPRWMTSIANLLPRVDTDSESSLNLSAEVAVSIPNPNVKGEAYIDDMEGVEDSDMIGLTRQSWYEASPPLDPGNPTRALPPSDSIDASWFNVNRKDQAFLATSKRDFNPGLDQRENTSVTSLFLRLNDLDNVVFPDPERWYGVMTGFTGGIDLTTAQYLEIWVNDFQPDSLRRGGRLRVDFGTIDEDFYNPLENKADDERNPTFYTWNANDNDIGFDAYDLCQYPSDNLQYDPVKRTYTDINCRANNGIHDSEDLDKSGYVEQINSYYSLALDLGDSAIVDVQRDYDKDSYSEYWYEGDNNPNLKKAWRMYRLDMSKIRIFSENDSPPSMDAIRHMRFWIEDAEELYGLRERVLEIAQVKFVGSRWEFDGIRDLNDEPIPLPSGEMLVKIGTINNKENPDYRSPYSVEQEEGITNREQALLFGFENLQDSTSFRSIKRFFGTGQDYRQYREMRFFIFPDIELIGLNDGVDTLASFYLQVAYDSFNYYEIEVPITPDDIGDWINATITMSDLTNMKIQSTSEMITEMISDAVDPDRRYIARVLGDPTLFQVRYIYAGVRNLSGGVIREGQIYMNDLKLGGVRRDIDHAERLSFSSNFANIFQLSGGWQRTGPEFRTLRQKTGSGVTSNSISLNGKTRVNYIIPTGGFELPVSVKYNSSTALPKYVPRSDVEIADEAVRDSLKTVNNNYSFSVSMSRKGSTNFLMKHVFDNMKAGFNYSKKNLKSHSALDTTWTMSGNMNYQVHFRKDRQLTLFRGIKWRYWLSNFSYSSSASRSTKRYYSLSAGEFVKRPTGFGANMDSEISTLYNPFESMKLSFNMNEKRNLAIDHDFHGIPIGARTEYNHNIMLQFQPRGNFFLLSQFNPNFEYKSRYQENLQPSIRQMGDPFGTRDVSANRDISIVFDFDVARYVTRFGQMVNLLEEGEIERAGRRQGRSSAERKEDFKDWLKQQQKPKTSDKSGKIESIFEQGETPPGRDESVPPPPPGTVPPTQEPEREETPEAGGFEKLGITKPREGVTEPTEGEETGEQKKAAEPDTTKGRRYDPLILPKQILRFIGKIEPIKTAIRINRSSNYQRLFERAGIAYQLGLSDEAGVPGKSGTVDSLVIEKAPARATGGLVLDFNTGVAVTSNLDVDIRASYNKSTTDVSGSTTETERLSWPSLTFKWSGIEKRRFLSRFIKQSDMTVKFERRIQRAARSEEINYQLSPNWNLTWKNSLSTNVAVTFTQQNREETGQETWKRSWGVNLDMKYAFKRARGFSLPLPFLSKKKIKFKSTLTTALNIGYTRATSNNQPPSNSLTISPRASYKFSERITGALNINYSRNAGGILGYVYHKVGMHLSAEFKF